MNGLKITLYTAYVSIVLYLVFIGGNEYRHFHPFLFDKPVNLYPFRQKLAYLSGGHFEDHNEVNNMIKDITGNLLLFVPLSFILILGENRAGRKTLLFVFASSVSIELIQYFFALGEADIDDVILNSAGALLGILLSLWIKRCAFWQQLQVR